jgi:hypothetical protein
VSALTDKGSLLAFGGDIESAKGLIECINPLSANVEFG